MIVDASVICAIILDEPERFKFSEILVNRTGALASPVQIWEAGVTLTRRLEREAMDEVEQLCSELGVQTATLGKAETQAAFDAWRRYGKGRHPAQLNLGDCFAYGLAKSRDLPLLFKGADFAKTDVRSAA